MANRAKGANRINKFCQMHANNKIEKIRDPETGKIIQIKRGSPLLLKWVMRDKNGKIIRKRRVYKHYKLI